MVEALIEVRPFSAARQSILANESFAHFLDRSALLTVPNFDPFEHSETLNSALRVANIAAFVRIVDAPAEAAESLEPEADRSASTALKEAWARFFPLCVPKPWTSRTGIQLLVDMATQVSTPDVQTAQVIRLTFFQFSGSSPSFRNCKSRS